MVHLQLGITQKAPLYSGNSSRRSSANASGTSTPLMRRDLFRHEDDHEDDHDHHMREHAKVQQYHMTREEEKAERGSFFFYSEGGDPSGTSRRSRRDGIVGTFG